MLAGNLLTLVIARAGLQASGPLAPQFRSLASFDRLEYAALIQCLHLQDSSSAAPHGKRTLHCIQAEILGFGSFLARNLVNVVTKPSAIILLA
jgi:hypothetical protein